MVAILNCLNGEQKSTSSLTGTITLETYDNGNKLIGCIADSNNINFQNRFFDEEKIIFETMMCFKRAGCSAIITYFAPFIAKQLINKNV